MWSVEKTCSRKAMMIPYCNVQGEKEAHLAMSEIHDGICGAHQVGDKIKWVHFRCKYIWPTMIKDYYDYAKSCEDCQKHGQLQ